MILNSFSEFPFFTAVNAHDAIAESKALLLTLQSQKNSDMLNPKGQLLTKN